MQIADAYATAAANLDRRGLVICTKPKARRPIGSKTASRASTAISEIGCHRLTALRRARDADATRQPPARPSRLARIVLAMSDRRPRA